MGMGEGGADKPSASLGTRFERSRVGGLRGGSSMSEGCADAGRAGGGPSGEGGGMVPSCLPGEAV